MTLQPTNDVIVICSTGLDGSCVAPARIHSANRGEWHEDRGSWRRALYRYDNASDAFGRAPWSDVYRRYEWDFVATYDFEESTDELSIFDPVRVSHFP